MMNNQNTMGKIEFLVEHVIWGVIAFLWYRGIFRCVGDYSLVISRLILFGNIVIVSLIFLVVEFRRSRNGFSVFFNLISGYGLYTVFAYMQFRKILIQISLITAIFLSFVFTVYIMTRKMRNKKNVKKIIKRRICKSLLFTRAIIGLGMSVIVIVIGVSGVLGNAILYSESISFAQTDIEDQTLANNIETVALLEETRWKELSAQEKINVLQTVANIEQRYLGLPHELNVGATNLKDGTLGNYCDATHQITIDLNHLVYDSPESVLNTILHEAWHDRCCDAYKAADDKSRSLKLFRKAAVYGEEFAHYIDGDEDIYGYYMQACEEDSRDYAKTAVEDYYEKINAFYGEDVTEALNDGGNSYQMSYFIVYEDDGYAYLEEQDGDTIAGPYLHIEKDIAWLYDEACRYTGMNGLIGYLDTEGHEITEPKFMEASEMQDGKAMVGEKLGSIYYINDDGERFTEDFLDGVPYEHQGCFARVLREDGWAIINREGDTVFTGADSINELPMITILGSAVKEGHAMIFDLDADGGFQIIKEFDQFNEISLVYYATFAIVRNRDDQYGVVDYKGDLIIEPQYRNVDFEIIDDGDNSWYGDHVRFKLQNPDGTYAIKEIKL